MADVPGCSLDWPLSREEKKSRVLRLYDDDLQAADQLVKTGEAAIAELRGQLVKSRVADPSDYAKDENIILDRETNELQFDERSDDEASHDKKEAAERLRLAIVSMQEVLDSLRGTPSSTEIRTIRDEDKRRARSEGAKTPTRTLSPALRQTPRRRRSRGGEPLRVSFEGLAGKVPPDSEIDPHRRPGHDKEQAYLQEVEDEPEPAPAPPCVSETSAPIGSPVPFPYVWRRALGSSLAFETGRRSSVMSIDDFLNEDVPDFPFSALPRQPSSRDSAPMRWRQSFA